MNPHLSLFKPYDREVRHEDQLTRAALIVMKYVPFTQDVFLEMLKEERLSSLPSPRFDMQTGTLAKTETEGEDIEIKRLVSVFLTPREASMPSGVVDHTCTRNARRYDGVVQYGAKLLLVIESKLFERSSDRQAVKLNVGSVSPEETIGPVHVNWNDLLDRWWNLTGLDLLGPAERSLLRDFFDFAEEHFAWLLPFTDLARCGSNRRRRQRRLRSLLAEATRLPVDEVSQGAQVMLPSRRVTSTQRFRLLCLKEDSVGLFTWPAELTKQAKHLYENPDRVEALIRVGQEEGWTLQPNFHVSYFNAPAGMRWYATCRIDAEDYLRQWVEDISEAGRHSREKFEDPGFWSWALERGYASPEDKSKLEEFLDRNVQNFDIRPSIRVSKRWPWREAVALDAKGWLASEVRAAADAVLQALDEPTLEQL